MHNPMLMAFKDTPIWLPPLYLQVSFSLYFSPAAFAKYNSLPVQLSTVRVGRDLRRSQIQPPALSRGSCKARWITQGFGQFGLKNQWTGRLYTPHGQVLIMNQFLLISGHISVVSANVCCLLPSHAPLCEACLCLLDALPVGAGGLLFSSHVATLAPGWTSPAPSASPDKANAEVINQHGGPVLNSVQFIGVFPIGKPNLNYSRHTTASAGVDNHCPSLEAHATKDWDVVDLLRCQGTQLCNVQLDVCRDLQGLFCRAVPHLSLYRCKGLFLA